MSPDWVGGAIGGAAVTAVFKLAEKIYELRMTQSLEARRTLSKYAKPLWFACHNFEHRVKRLEKGLKNPNVLAPPQPRALEWYTKAGYFVTSTAYLISAVAAWINLFERDVVFLEFREGALTAEFFRQIEGLKNALSDKPSVLWYHYLDAIGEQLLVDEARKPMTFAAFIQMLHRDSAFREFYDQLFQYLYQLKSDRFKEHLDHLLEATQSVKKFLEDHEAVPRLEQREGNDATMEASS